ncbi:probable plastid-lipid-associated protein 14, chloroplastic [Momordica charantia]|uniref:Probable plastid-lipid-associated protein 14, chloroplastic n=1 Tax=Momordica charantia TaxID=3673 RepID=A0A6J1CHC1_MOMCH|nr:probable plastid-lipid-associated protein 14, chloroplastic [Momordica charantia]XP_022140872.1 probable plastid-lipid-associated protein 14, chloroplastic [Momordica charantia]
MGPRHEMALNPSSERIMGVCFKQNLSTTLIGPLPVHFVGKYPSSNWAPCSRLLCSSVRKDASVSESKRNAPSPLSVSVEEELDHVVRFKISDFKILDCVSTGLGGRADEVVFEALVKNCHSPLYNTKVVLRRLKTPQAQRRGKRAIEVLKKLARRRLMYHSYSMQIHGYISSLMSNGRCSFTLVHGHHGSFSLRHWLQQSDWLPTLEATLALDEESARKVGDTTSGGPAVSRHSRLIRVLMRDLLIGVNYLHSHGLAHTELRLENIHLSPVDRHVKVGILGNASYFHEHAENYSTSENSFDRRQMMIAFDMRCVGFMMAKMVLQELMDPLIFTKFKSFFSKGQDSSCLREYLLQVLQHRLSSGNVGLQILDRNWGAGWNLLSLLLANSPSKRISCLEALRHPFLCGPRWRVAPSVEIIRWGLGSTAVRITEEYIYSRPQRSKLSHFIELMEMLSPHSKPKHWQELIPGKWRFLYSTGKHIGLTLRQPPARVLVGDVCLTVARESKLNNRLSLISDIGFTVMRGRNWPHNKMGVNGKLVVNSSSRIQAGRRLYLKEENTIGQLSFGQSNVQHVLAQKLSSKKWRKVIPFEELPSSLPAIKLISGDIDVKMSLDDPLSEDVDAARNVVREVRTQVPPELFDLSKLICGTYVDSRLLILRSVDGSALLFTRSCLHESHR